MITKKLLTLVLVMMIVATGASPGSSYVRRTKKRNDEKDVIVKRHRGKDGKVKEVDVEFKIHACDKGSDECKNMGKQGTVFTDEEEFAKALTDKMLHSVLEEEEGEPGGKGKEDGGHEKYYDPYYDPLCWVIWCNMYGVCWWVMVCNYA